MSGSVKLTTPSSGAVILTPASSIASDVTVQVPSQNCTLGIQGPAFSAYRTSNVTVSNNVWTKVQLNAEEFDTNNNFDSTTNYRFTPTIAGYYLISGSVQISWNTGSGPNWSCGAIYKNGSLYREAFLGPLTANVGNSTTTDVIYFNGSTDYVELYVIINAADPFYAGTSSGVVTYMSGALVRAA